MIAQRLVRSFCIVEGEPVPNSFSGLARRLVFVEVHLFVFDASPEPFREDVIRGSTFPVHADLDVPGKEAAEIAVTGEVRSLVTVENGRRSGRKGPIHCVQDKRHLQALIQLPRDDKPGMPVDNGHKVHPSLKQPDVSDVDSPDMVGILGRDITKKIRIDLVLQSPLAEVGSGMDPFDSHLPHVGLHAGSSHREAVPLENGGNAAAPVERPPGIDLVDPVPKSHLFF